MFAINLDYPSFKEEVEVVKTTTSDEVATINPLFTAEEILSYQHVIRRIPVADNVVEYAVEMVAKTRPDSDTATDLVKHYIDWGAGPRASQAAKTHAAILGKFSPDIENVQAVANPILRHRIIKNYKAEAEGVTDELVIQSLF
jgi:MoxR-like ATPase